jgi:SRSO17 transposase
VLGIKSNEPFHSWGMSKFISGTVKEIADGLPASAWRRLSPGAGTKGERLHDWAYLELADLDAGDYTDALAGVSWTRGLLIRRKIAGGDLAFFTTWAPSGTSIERLAKIEGLRWAIEDSFETAKNELGLDHNETRSWHGWRRHVSLVMLAFAMMAAIRAHANAVASPPKTIRRTKTSARACRRRFPDPLVDAGNPPFGDALGEKTHSTRVHHCLVALETSPSGARRSHIKMQL